MNNEELMDRLWQAERAHDETCAALATAERERDEARAERDNAIADRTLARAELARERADLAALTARVEAEIAAAAEAVRARAIAECVALCAASRDEAYARHSAAMGRNAIRDGMEELVRAQALGNAIAALAAQQPAPTEPADVDPAAGALR